MSIPPRPWRVESREDYHPDGETVCDGVVDADGYDVIKTDTGVYPPNLETAEHICRFVNAEPVIVAALRLADEELSCRRGGDPACQCGPCVAAEAVRAALAKLRG